LKRLIRPAIALALTGWILWRAHPSAVVDAARDANLSWIAAAIALVLIDRALMAYRAVALLAPIEPPQRPPLGDVVRIFFESTFLGTFLPASIGGDAARAFALAQLQVPGAAAVASVLMDRLLGVVSILIVGVAGLLLSRSGDFASTRAIELSLGIGGLAALAASTVVFSERAAAAAQSIAAWLPFAPLRRIGGELTRATRAYGTHHGTLAAVLAASVAVQAIRIVQAYCLGRALHIDAPLAVYFEFIPLILLVMLLPVSINGIGPSQVAFVWFFSRAGVPDAQSFALSILFVALGIVGNLPGGFIWATKRKAA
jgi:uncharacterized protein (TIRG00374 family)